MIRFGPADVGGLGDDELAERVLSESICQALLEDREDATLHDLFPSGREVRVRAHAPRGDMTRIQVARRAERVHLHRGKAAGTREEGEHGLEGDWRVKMCRQPLGGGDLSKKMRTPVIYKCKELIDSKT